MNSSRISKAQLRRELELALKRHLPHTTLWRWLDFLAIGSKKRYTSQEFEILLDFGSRLTTTRSYKTILEDLEHERQQNDRQSNAEEPSWPGSIDIEFSVEVDEPGE